MAMLSVVSAVYRADDCIEELYSRLVSALSFVSVDFEIILAEDHSGDRSWEKIAAIAKRDASSSLQN